MKKKAAKARKQAEEAKAAKLAKAHKGPKALQNGGKGDGTKVIKGKGKGQGPPRKKVTEKTEPIGSEICYGYNNGNKCKMGKDCTRAHVCQICEGPHPASTCPDLNK